MLASMELRYNPASVCDAHPWHSAASITLRVLQELACVNMEWDARAATAVAGMFSLVAGQAFKLGDPRPAVWEEAQACAWVCGFEGVCACYRDVNYLLQTCKSSDAKM